MGVTLKLPQLQNLCKRDPEGYREDYEAQIRRLESEVGILALQPSADPSPSLIELIQFAAAVSSSSYKGKESDRIANFLISLLLGQPLIVSGGSDPPEAVSKGSSAVTYVSSMPAAALQLHRDVRKTCVSALILMRNKGVVEPLRLLTLFFRIMSVVQDKALREILYRHLVNDIRNINKKGRRDDAVNRSVQSFLHKVVSTHGTTTSTSTSSLSATGDEAATDIAARRATDLVCELYRRRVWTEERTVAIVASAVQSPNTTVMCRAMRFFLNIEEKMAADAKEQEEEEWNEKSSIDYHLHSKRTASRQRHTQRQLKNQKKTRRKKEGADEWMETDPNQDRGVEASKKLYPAIELLRDPQGLAEFVFKRLRSGGSYKYEVKLLMINFVTRLVGNHELLLLPLYPFLQKYMGGHQRDVTGVLAYTVQACHESVPPDEIYGILKTIAHNFITERCSEEQMAVGINAARAICARVPSSLSIEESQASTGSTVMDMEAFARDLAAYGNHRDRSVSIAGKAWTNFVREVNPGLLQGKSRGLKGTALHKAGAKPLRYGERKVAAGVEGADLLLEYEAKKAAKRRQSGADDDGSASDDDVSGEWQEMDDNSAGEDDGKDEEAPQLVLLGDEKAQGEGQEDDSTDNNNSDDEAALDITKLSAAEREKLKQQVSSTRIFSVSDFAKMRKLVERERRARQDPREAARRKRAVARGEDFEELSESDDDDSDEEVHIAGAVNPTDLMAEAKKKRQSKAEKLEKIIAGRSEFESKKREGGSTNVEKKRKKNFLMSKFSSDARTKGRGKSGLHKKRGKKQIGHESKKRRRKL